MDLQRNVITNARKGTGSPWPITTLQYSLKVSPSNCRRVRVMCERKRCRLTLSLPKALQSRCRFSSPPDRHNSSLQIDSRTTSVCEHPLPKQVPFLTPMLGLGGSGSTNGRKNGGSHTLPRVLRDVTRRTASLYCGLSRGATV